MPNATAPYMSLNGRIVPYEACTIHAFAAGMKYGVGVFEGLRGYWNAERNDMFVFRLRNHLERLRYGMRVLRLEPIFDARVLQDALLAMIRANDLRESSHLRIIAFLDADDDYAATGPAGFVCGAVPKPRSASVTTGIHVAVASYARLADNAMPPRVKCTGNYVNNRAAEMEARRNGYDGALMLTAQGKVSEGTGACFFMVRDGVLHTPDVASDILESITRDSLIRLAGEQLGLTVCQRTIDRHEIYAADEAFWCGSSYEVQPILSLDRLAIGCGAPGPVTQALQRAYFAAAEGHTDDHADWRSPVYANA